MAKSLNRETLAKLAPKLAELSQEILFNDIWNREVLTPRERSLITLGALTALGRVFDRHYKSGGRSDNFIQFPILAGRPRSFAQKQNLSRVLCDRLHADLNIPPDDVMVMIQFNSVAEWSFSQGRMLSEEQ